MAKKTEPTSLSEQLSEAAKMTDFAVWVVGLSPLICHAWSQKAKLEMLQTQVGSTKDGRKKRNPEKDFQDSLYPMDKKRTIFGFPAMGFKNAILTAAHKDKGVPKTSVQGGLWLDADIVRQMPALAGAICDVPLNRIYGSEPEMREDMVRIGGRTKTATLAYRAQFSRWAVHLTGSYRDSLLDASALITLLSEAGMSAGVGEWRNDKSGFFGRFRPAKTAEAKAWDRYAAGKGKIPDLEVSPRLAIAAE